jgi:hypothetical protein
MKHQDKKIEEKVEEALHYYGKERYESNPFMYTRIQQQLRNEADDEKEVQRFWAWKPVLAAVMIVLNATVVYQSFQVDEGDLSAEISSVYEIEGNERMYYDDYSNN